jgi:hypothetical protein
VQRSVTVHHLDAHGAIYRREQRSLLELVTTPDGRQAIGAVVIDDLGRRVTYDLGTGLPLEGGDTVLCRVSMDTLLRKHAAKGQLTLPGVDL